MIALRDAYFECASTLEKCNEDTFYATVRSELSGCDTTDAVFTEELLESFTVNREFARLSNEIIRALVGALNGERSFPDFKKAIADLDLWVTAFAAEMKYQPKCG